jgi:hypothetical protein
MVGGTVMPRAFAVFRLNTSSNLLAACVDVDAVAHELQASLVWGIAGQSVRVIIVRAYIVVAVIGALSAGEVPSAVAAMCLNAGYTSEATTHGATPETSHVTTTAITSITTSSRECAGSRGGERECCCKNCCEGEFLAHESFIRSLEGVALRLIDVQQRR